jgi:hypothetical protein
MRRQIERLAPLPRALLLAAYASRSIKCSCGARCCSGGYLNSEWNDAMHEARALQNSAYNIKTSAI